MKSLFSLFMAIVLAAGVVALGFWGYRRVSENRADIEDTRTLLMATLNREFPNHKFDPLEDMNLPNTSMFTGVPDDVYFNEYAYQTDRTGKRYCKATVEGHFLRTSGKVNVSIDFTQDARARVTKTLYLAVDEDQP